MYHIYWPEEKAYYTETVGDTDNFTLEREYAREFATQETAESARLARNLDDCVVTEGR